MKATSSNVHAVWITTGFFEVVDNATVKLAGETYHNSFQCIPSSLPAASGAPLFLAPGTPLRIRVPTGRLASRLQLALAQREVLPSVEVQRGNAAGSTLRLERVRVTGMSLVPGSHQISQVTIVHGV